MSVMKTNEMKELIGLLGDAYDSLEKARDYYRKGTELVNVADVNWQRVDDMFEQADDMLANLHDYLTDKA